MTIRVNISLYTRKVFAMASRSFFKICLGFAAFAWCAILYAQPVTWPAGSAQTKPFTRWWWQGSAVNKPELLRHLTMYQQAGLGGVEVTPIFGVRGQEANFINYLSPTWMDMLEYTLSTAAKLGMQVDMATGTGWPFGGPWIDYTHACKQVQFKSWVVNKGQPINDRVAFTQEAMVRGASSKPLSVSIINDPVETNSNLQDLAIDQIKFAKPLPLITLMAYPPGQKPIDLTSLVNAEGQLNWTAPTDSCKVYALFMGWHGKMVERAAPGGEGNAIDHFSRAAIDAYFQKFDNAFRGRKLQGLRCFFNDSYEVDDARGQSNWTPQFLQEFENRRGYDLRLWLPQLLQPNGSLTHKRVLFDYRQTIADLILENFTQPWANWAHQKGALVRNQSHGSPGNTMDLYAAVDIPETEGTELMRFKFATSTAHVAGKKLVAAEAATWLGDHFESTLGQVKRLIDLYFLGGVNHIVFHGTNYSPAHAAWPGWLFYAAVHFHPNNPFWQHLPALNAYIDRCQRFLQAGKPDNDVLIYYPYADAQMEPGRDLLKHYDAMRPEFNNTPFADIADRMQKQGYTFDFISDKQVLGVTTQDGELLTGGTRYKAIMLPANQYIPLGTMEYLISLVNKGATLLVYRQMPANVPGLANYKADSAALKQLINTIRFTQNGEVYKASLGKGTIWMSQQETALLEDAGIRKEAMAAYGLQTIRRRINGGTAYFIVNTGSRVVDTLIPLQVPDKHAVLFNPMNGQVGLAKYKASPDKPLLVHVQLQPAETVIVQTYAAKPVANPYTYFRVSGNAWPLHTTWKVQFLQGGPVLPPAHTTRHLTSFTTWGQPYAAFSGLAAYTARFKKPAQAADAYLLNIEQVGSQVQVFINNKPLATIIDTPYQVIIPASLLKPVNTLRLEVTNSMANRIIDMEQKGEAYKIFYNTNFPAKLAVNRGPDGLFTAKHWPPFASGIMGQVSLTPLQKF